MKFVRLADESALLMMAPLMGAKSNFSGALHGTSDFLGGGEAWALYGDQGQMLAMFVVQRLAREFGRELVVRAGLSLGGLAGLTETILPEIERIFGDGCDVVTIQTRRQGLVRKLQKAGYADVATIMQKRIKK